MAGDKLLQEALKDILCCPECKNELRLVNGNELKCQQCFQKYDIKNGIPVLICGDRIKDQPAEWKMREKTAKEQGYTHPEEILRHVSFHHCLPVMSKKARSYRKKFSSSRWILDIGSGTGWYWASTSGGNILLLDFAFENLMAAKTLLGNDGQVLPIQANSGLLPIKTNCLSGLWSVQATQHFPEPVIVPFLQETKRVLKDKFLVEIYNLNPAWIHKIIYGLFGKKYHTKGKWGNMVFNRLNKNELNTLWRDVARDAITSIGYSELFFHPDFRLCPKGEYISIFEDVFNKLPGSLGRTFARQIHIKISSRVGFNE